MEPYGTVVALDVKRGQGSCFAFLELSDAAMGDVAIRELNGRELGSMRLVVQAAKGKGVSVSSRGPPRRSEWRVAVSNLPAGSSWQDLKDVMRSAGEVGFANVTGSTGVVEFSCVEDYERALRTLEDRKSVV